ncbi:MAG: adenylate kinase [Candidatus ainarchaeum sp.]|nr:adenylate kinase [Candidatus ainarchaeum sp.]
MNLVFIGKQGVGKGTYAQRLALDFEIPQISTGDLLREEIKSGSELGKKVQAIMNSGSLVPDEIVIEIFEKRIQQGGTEKGFILDGFPRTENQAESLDALMQKLGKKIDLALNFTAPDKVLLSRLTGRRQCRQCGAIYHLRNLKPKVEGVCDKCGGSLYQREDDKEEAIRKRWAAYEKQTKPVLAFYGKQKKIIEVDASKEIGEIYPSIIKTLGNKKII